MTASIVFHDSAAKAGEPRPGVVYMTGLSGAGKSTLAVALRRSLLERGVKVCVLDGDELRNGVCKDLGFSDTDRLENMRRATEIARLLMDAGVLVIVSLISPFRAARDAARERFAPGEFMELFIDAPLSVCEARDPKGLYARARRGEIPRFTGIDSPYEPPLAPELRIDTAHLNLHQTIETALRGMAEFGFLPPLPMHIDDRPDPAASKKFPSTRSC